MLRERLRNTLIASRFKYCTCISCNQDHQTIEHTSNSKALAEHVFLEGNIFENTFSESNAVHAAETTRETKHDSLCATAWD